MSEITATFRVLKVTLCWRRVRRRQPLKRVREEGEGARVEEEGVGQRGKAQEAKTASLSAPCPCLLSGSAIREETTGHVGSGES